MVTYTAVREVRAKDIREEEKDLVLGIVGRRSGDVRLDAVNLFPFACRIKNALVI